MIIRLIFIQTEIYYYFQRPFASEKQGVYRSARKNILLSLYFDVLLCMATNITKDDYVKGQRSGIYGTAHFPDFDKSVDVNLRQTSRQVLWETLSEFKIQGGKYLKKK